jgi:trans-aconitate methyltransferase
MTLLILLTAIAVFVLRVPFVATPSHIADAMINLIDWKGTETVIDLGCGDGRLLEAVKKRYPKITAIGCELSPVIWLMGVLRSMVLRTGVQVYFRSIVTQDVSQTDVVFLYLFPHVMQKLQMKLDAELKPGTIVVCQTFGFPNRVPDKTIRVSRFGSEVSVFLYRWPAKPDHRGS